MQKHVYNKLKAVHKMTDFVKGRRHARLMTGKASEDML